MSKSVLPMFSSRSCMVSSLTFTSLCPLDLSKFSSRLEPTGPLLGTCSRETLAHIQQEVCTMTFVVAVTTVEKTWMSPGKVVNKVWQSHPMGHYTAFQMEEQCNMPQYGWILAKWYKVKGYIQQGYIKRLYSARLYKVKNNACACTHTEIHMIQLIKKENKAMMNTGPRMMDTWGGAVNGWLQEVSYSVIWYPSRFWLSFYIMG